jgi:hypothetical protein
LGLVRIVWEDRRWELNGVTVISKTLLRRIDRSEGDDAGEGGGRGHMVGRGGAGVGADGFVGVIVAAHAVDVVAGRVERKEPFSYVYVVGDRGIEKPLSYLGGIV